MKLHIHSKGDDWHFQRRPWGWMIKIWHSKNIWIKLLHVYTRNSLQSHENREEYHIRLPWVWLSKFIAKKEVHRMTRGWYIEIATGTPTENDITRYEDDYGRV